MTTDEENMQVIKEKIFASDLDGDTKIRAVCRLDTVFNEYGRVCNCTDVGHFFNWASQPEGYGFWSRVRDVIEGNDCCEDDDAYWDEEDED